MDEYNLQQEQGRTTLQKSRNNTKILAEINPSQVYDVRQWIRKILFLKETLHVMFKYEGFFTKRSQLATEVEYWGYIYMGMDFNK